MQCCYANPELYVDPDAFYEIRPECRDDVPITRFKPLPGRTLSARRWQASFSPDGHLDIISVLKRIQRGGVHPTIKGEVWEFLLGCYDPNSTFEQRNELRQSRRSEYEGLKNKCKEMEKSVGSGVVITMPLITDDGQPVEASRNIHNKTEPPVGTETESPVEKTESPVDKGETEDPVEGETESPVEGETESPVEGETESPVDKGETEDPVEGETESPVEGETEDPVGKETESPVGKETESSVGKETESPVGKETESSVGKEETEDPVGKETEDPVEDEKEAAVDRDVVQWKLSLHQIGLDVVRTDRSLVYYEDPVHRARLWDLLAVYSWIDKDINYCQGMSDLCSPISILIENEADAFWCFERLMRRLRGNFKSTSTSIGVRSQLTTLSNIIKSVDPKLHQHIEELDGGEYLFAFRMLMVLFRREFSFVDSLYLWELMWGMEYNPNTFSLYQSSADISALPATSSSSTSSLHHSNSLKKYGRFEKRNLQKNPNPQIPPFPVFIVAGVLEAKSKRLKKEAKGLDDVVKILNDITGSLDAKKACKEALKVHKKYLNMVKVS